MDDAGRIQEGRAWFDSILADENARHLEVAAAVRARALADKALLDIFVDAAAGMEQAQQALVIAREVDEPALLSRALTACGLIAVAVARADAAASYFAEAIDLARAVDDRWRLAQILTFQAVDAVVAGDPVAARPAAQEARELAAAIGDHSNALWCRWCLGYAQLMRGAGRGRRPIRRGGGRGRGVSGSAAQGQQPAGPGLRARLPG